MHLGTGFVCGYKIMDTVQAGFEFTILIADWHAWINNKFGGDSEAIRECGEYFKDAFSAIGLPYDKVRYLWASELVEKQGYWKTVIKVAKKANISRITRCLPIMGRDLKSADMETAYLIYPCMQAADIFQLEVDCAVAGVDQRKAHMLARDVAEKLSFKKPVCIHTHLLMGLQGPEKVEAEYDEDEALSVKIGAKMSKSKPESCIYIHDSPDDVSRKIANAYCPPKIAAQNPVMEIAKYVVFAKENMLSIERKEKYGGPVDFYDYCSLEKAYVDGKLHPQDLKQGVSEALIEILEPIRRKFKGRENMIEKIKKL